MKHIRKFNEANIERETLEEAAEKYSKQFDYAEDSSPPIDFVEGAKWMQERMYSEEDMIEFAFNTYHYISELMGVPFNLISENKLHAKYNFENFKKK